VQQIFSTDSAFAALKSDGSVVTWGDTSRGGNSSSVSTQLSGGVEKIVGNQHAFAALKSDGSLVAWGSSGFGGDSSSVSAQLSSGVRGVASPFAEETPTSGGGRGGSASSAGITLTAGETIVIGGAKRLSLGLAATTTTSGNLTAMSLVTVELATDTLQRADVALQTIATQRARLGATLSRFDALIGDLGTAGSNLTASRSRILDADVAAETAALTRTQIIQQAGQAMLAQANTNPRLILSLLRTDR
jgi:flagellin-like hook-associated protein FlgL